MLDNVQETPGVSTAKPLLTPVAQSRAGKHDIQFTDQDLDKAVYQSKGEKQTFGFRTQPYQVTTAEGHVFQLQPGWTIVKRIK